MQSLQPDPAARYRNVMDALRRIVATEGVWRPMRGLNATAVGAGPAHALYFACYEKLKKTLSDVIHPGANSHLANGTIKHRHASNVVTCKFWLTSLKLLQVTLICRFNDQDTRGHVPTVIFCC